MPEFPAWQNVYRTFRRWSEQGKFEQMHDRPRAMWRERQGRSAEPTAAVLDAQSTRSSPQGGASGYDAGKKVKGRKRMMHHDRLTGVSEGWVWLTEARMLARWLTT
jgi:transposase